MSTQASSPSEPIPLALIGWGRTNGVTLAPEELRKLKAPYTINSMTDFVETLEPYRYSPHNLAVVLHNLNPRPRALVVGVAVPPSLTDEITAVWNEYVDTVLKLEFKENDEWKKNVLVHLQLWHYVDPKDNSRPPYELKWAEETCKQLDAVFRPEITWGNGVRLGINSMPPTEASCMIDITRPGTKSRKWPSRRLRP